MTMTIEEAAKQLATRLDIPTPDGESLAEFRLSFDRLLYINDLKTELMELAESRTLMVRRHNGGPLPKDSMVSESSQVDIAEAQAALEGVGRKFVLVESVSSSGVPERGKLNDWINKSREIAQRIGVERWNAGQRQISGRNIAGAVTQELAKDKTTHGLQGPRSEDNVRNIGLKGWRFISPD